MFRKNAPLLLKLLFLPALLFLFLSVRFYLTNQTFVRFTRQMFEQGLADNTLNLHYTLADPLSHGIKDSPVTLGDASPKAMQDGLISLENAREVLSHISVRSLSDKNQLTYEILHSYLDTQMEAGDFLLYPEPLGPTIGTQAQLPVLLAEYRFDNPGDVQDYLTLLSQMDTYYDSILKYEQAKAKAGLFMSDSCADHIIEQCQAFLNSEENFLIPVFQEKLQALDEISPDKKQQLMKQHQQILSAHVFPAYEKLARGLTALKGSGKNSGGLCGLPKGKAYYEYLVKDSTGCSLTVPEIEKRIQKQLQSDFLELQTLVRNHPNLLSAKASSSALSNPTAILSDLKEKIQKDFPTPPPVSCQIKYVHPSLESFLSPAFYLTPPMDALSQNVISLNQKQIPSSLELYTTLAHEGYPGHLYQTIYSGSIPYDPVRSLLNFGGYVEGWATYVEFYSYSLSDFDPPFSSLYRLDRSIILGISSLLDIAIHYHGYTREQTAHYLSQIGFRDSSSADSLYDTILESPANYLKYYVGCLCFFDLRDQYQKEKGDDFSLKDFHQKVLEIGPAPFDILQKRLLHTKPQS